MSNKFNKGDLVYDHVFEAFGKFHEYVEKTNFVHYGAIRSRDGRGRLKTVDYMVSPAAMSMAGPVRTK